MQCKETEQVPGDSLDNDCDGKIDEEVRDGKDNDGDGKIDEDLDLVREEIVYKLLLHAGFIQEVFQSGSFRSYHSGVFE